MSAYESIAPASAILGQLFYYDPTDKVNAKIREWLCDDSTAADWEFGQPEASSYLRELKAAAAEDNTALLHTNYNRFFVGPYKLPAPPWGSVYTDPESVIFGNETLAVRQWMRDNLVKMNLKDKEPEDHIGLMLLMASWAIQHDVADDQITALFEDHLLPWVYRYLDLLIAAAEDQHPEPPMASVPAPEPSPFYAALGKLTKATLKDWQQRFSWIPREAPLAR